MLNSRIPRAGRIVVLALWLALPTLSRPAQGAVVSPERPAEYMVYQYADTALVLRIDAPGTEFSVRTIGPDSALIKSSSVPGRRIGPIFQFVDSAARPRQLMIEVTPERPVDRNGISLELLQFAPGDPNAAALVRAYRLYSAGTETVHTGNTSTWAAKSWTLRSAAEAFSAMGMEEMRLWSEYFSALLVLNQLDDPLTAIELAQEIAGASKRAGLTHLEFAASVLEADARFELAFNAGGASIVARLTEARTALAAAAAQARDGGLDIEEGRALYRDGQVLERQGEAEQALEQYGRALDLALLAGDALLANEIRGNAAALNESLGRTSGAIDLIDHITADLAAEPQDDSETQIAFRLFEKGRLLNASYRYAEAVPELSRALEMQRAGAGPWERTALELGWSSYALGDSDAAVTVIEAGLRRRSGTDDRYAQARAYGVLAAIRRQQNRPVDASRARQSQGELLGTGPGHASFLFDSAMDARSFGGEGSAQAESLLREAIRAAAEEDDEVTRRRARAWLCLLRSERQGQGGCDPAAAVADYGALRLAAVPAAAMDAMLVQVRILEQAGRRREARELAEALVSELHWYRSALPGVLGAWYAENRDTVATTYLGLARPAGGRDGRDLLLAVEHLRALEAADFSRPGDRPLGAAAEDSLRELLARREAARGSEGAQLASRLHAQLDEARGGAGRQPLVSAADLDRLLARLGPSECVLGYHFDGRQSLALLGRRGNVQAIPLPGAVTATDRLVELREALSGPEAQDPVHLLDSLGDDLLGPLQGALPTDIYLLPSGPLRGIPFDALRQGGRFIAERHALANLYDITTLARRQPRLPSDWQQHLFVAGNPQDQGDPFSLELASSPELSAVTDMFVGPGLHIVQGVALQKHEFDGERLLHADLVHLSLPGNVDLAFPDRSRMRLSAGPARMAWMFLSPPDVRALDLSGPLVVMTGTVVAGAGESLYDYRIAYAHDFLEAGAQAALLSLWSPPERQRLAFVTRLYAALQTEPDIFAALTATKRGSIGTGAPTNLSDWAGFQLFIR